MFAIFMSLQLGLFIDYNQFYQKAYDGKAWKDGTYFVLITADWCAPCQNLKSRLTTEFRHIEVVLVDFDTEVIKDKLMDGSDKKIPCFIRYDIKDGKSIRRYWDRAEDLSKFLESKNANSQITN